MRTGVIILATGVAALILVPAAYIYYAASSPPPATAPALEEIKTSVVARSQPIPARAEPRVIETEGDGADLSSPDHAAFVSWKKSQLGDLAAAGDPVSLKAISADLSNPDPDIRKAALIAAVDSGSQDVIPALQNEMEWTSDAQEKVELQKAIDFLMLPAAQPNGAE